MICGVRAEDVKYPRMNLPHWSTSCQGKAMGVILRG